MMKNTRIRLLELLERRRDMILSGEALAEELGVSRTAVWKAVRELREQGYPIEAGTNRGYRLLPRSDLLSLQGLAPYLEEGEQADIHILPSAVSTNVEAKKLGLEGAGHGTAVIAETQTEGRGRQGREFFSPPRSGLYLSVLLRPALLHLEEAASVTTAAAVSVCRSIREVTGRETGIKWVNDILLEKKKVCGILTEAVTDFESGQVEFLVAGVGINVTGREEDFPPALRGVAASLCPGSADGSMRSRLAAELIRQLREIGSGKQNYLDEYRRRCVVLGKPVTVHSQGESYAAHALDVDDRGRLLVRKETGELLALHGGEVSVRL